MLIWQKKNGNRRGHVGEIKEEINEEDESVAYKSNTLVKYEVIRLSKELMDGEK